MLLSVPCVCGCYAPLRSPGVRASSLPMEFRLPLRTQGPALNYARLTIRPPQDYILGPGDSLNITIPGLYQRAETLPMHVQVMASGEIHLPLVGAVRVAGMNLLHAQSAVNAAYANGFLQNPRINVVLAEKQSTTVLVLGQVKAPGAHILPKYENDVGHALAAAGGFTEDAADIIEVHRSPGWSRNPQDIAVPRLPPLPTEARAPDFGVSIRLPYCNSIPAPSRHEESQLIQKISLRGPGANALTLQDVMLRPGDVIVIPNRKHEVFFVVGKLSQTNTVRFTIGDRERELGVGFILPRDREIDVVTAVTMAGYIDPIDSPTTVTVQRVMPGGRPLLIHVDLIKARSDPRETVLVRPGDIIYLNPDAHWWFRRTLDRVIPRLVPDLITIPYALWVN